MLVDVIRDDRAVAELQHAVRDRRERLVVRHEHHRGALFAVDLAQGCEHELARPEVEVARRLVAEDELRVLGERSGDRDALLLAAGELRGEVELRSASPTFARRSRDRGGRLAVARGEVDGEAHVLPGSQSRDQVEELEDEADLLPAEQRELLRLMVEMSSPSNTIEPLVGESMPPMRFSSVVLPEPDGPRMATNSPRPIARSATWSACTSTSPIW